MNASERIKKLLRLDDLELGSFKGKTSEGIEVPCSVIVPREGTPFIVVTIDNSNRDSKVLGWDLAEDPAIASDLNHFLKEKGFSGRNVVRGAMAMQDANYMIFEPYDDFHEFAANLGWRG